MSKVINHLAQINQLQSANSLIEYPKISFEYPQNIVEGVERGGPGGQK